MWKGAVHEDMYITTPPTGGSCGFGFVEGEEYIVYGYDSPYAEGGYTAGICSRTALLGQAQADTDALGRGSNPLSGTGGPAPAQQQDSTADWITVLIPAVAVLVLLAGGIAAYTVLRRRQSASR